MEVIETTSGVRTFLKRLERCQTVGLVATMGGLHDGHAALIRRSVKECDVTVVSLFVNPAQFAPTEDLESYPRTREEDLALCSSLGVDVIFAPLREDVYSKEFGTWVITDVGSAGANESSEGASRPTFFRGVATMVTKLLVLIRPDRTYFGQKDLQQCAVVRRLAEDMWLACEVVMVETVREKDGLAMSSRNAYLTAEERACSNALWKGLCEAKRVWEEGECSADALRAAALRRMAEEINGRGVQFSVNYVSVCNARTMREVEAASKDCAICVAAMMGRARLIDNVLLS